MTPAAPQHDRKRNTLGIGAMLLLTLLLGARSLQTVRSVLAEKVVGVEQEVPQPRLVATALLGVTARDSLVAVAVLASDQRDPFAGRGPTPRPRRPVNRPREAARVIEPLLAGLIFDNVNPTVQITVGSERSDWLRTGDQFQGWRVAEIDAKSVKVRKGDMEIVLH